ncbi:MAG: iron ABC transporter permease [Planctomycetes bacterium]|nr:iron ABC transporter permease [Planctomycetota bacterium]
MLSRTITRLPLILGIAFIVLFVILPLVGMLAETFWGAEGFDLSPWSHLFEEARDRQAFFTSIQLGFACVVVALVLGGGHAWLCGTRDLPGWRVLGPLGVLPLALPPITIAMGWSDITVTKSFWFCAVLVGVAFSPFVAVMTARGLDTIDGRSYESALLSRGRTSAELLVLRSALPEILAGALFVFVFAVGEYGVPEFLTIKGKTWHTYSEAVFARWTRRATGSGMEDLVGPIVASVPLLVLVLFAMFVALLLRARATISGAFAALPRRSLGALRVPALLLPITYLGIGVIVPIVVMVRWAMGSTDVTEPMSFAVLRQTFERTFEQAGSDLRFTFLVAVLTTIVLVVIGPPLARSVAKRGILVQSLVAIPIAVPAVLLAVGFVKVYNRPELGPLYDRTFDFYDSAGIVVVAYGARFLPFAILTMLHAQRRIDPTLEEAALFGERGPLARVLHVRLPLILPALWSMACLVLVLALRELDTAVVLPAGNGTVVRRLSNVIHFGGEAMGGALGLMVFAGACALPVVTMLVTGKKMRSLS